MNGSSIEGQGDVAKDSSGNGRDTKVSGASWAKQGGGFALNLDGESDYVLFDAVPGLALTGPVSVEAWIKPMHKSEALTGLLGQDLHTYLLTFSPPHRFYWHIGLGANGIGTQGKLQEWNHVVATFDGNAQPFFSMADRRPAGLQNFQPTQNAIDSR